jgi:hypothetical protein
MVEAYGRKFKLEKTNAKISSNGGLVLIDKMAEVLGVCTSIDEKLGHLKIRNRGYSISEKVMDLVRLYVAGGDAISDIRQLRFDEVLKGYLGRESVMACSTAAEFLAQLWGAEVHALSKVAGGVARDTVHLNGNRTATLDVDATFIAAEKQAALMSYHGRRGYYPMLGFVAETKGLLLAEFRDGNVSPSTDAPGFLRRLVSRLPKTVEKIRLRSDSAWFNHQVMDDCAREGIEFVVTAEINSHTRDLAARIPDQHWEVFGDDPDEQVAETVYSFERGTGAYRLIVLREPVRQMTLFNDKYVYRAIITNMDWEKRRLVTWHRERATSENWIKEMKGGFSLEHLPSGRFLSNAAFLQIISLAYNLVEALKVLGLPEEYRQKTVKSLRYRLFNIPAMWVRHARQWVLKLGVDKRLLDLINTVLTQPLKLCRT